MSEREPGGVLLSFWAIFRRQLLYADLRDWPLMRAEARTGREHMLAAVQHQPLPVSRLLLRVGEEIYNQRLYLR
jgi:hypothetical protein